MLIRRIHFKEVFTLSALGLLMVVVMLSSRAVAANQLVAQEYSASGNLQPGMIVRLTSSGSSQVTALDLNHINQMLGVVISAADAALTLGSSSANQGVYVSNFGQHSVLVTNQNGPIVAGDYITISALSGIGMKADSNESLVLGQATGSFDGVHNVLSSSNLTDSSGNNITVSIGSIPVNVNISSNPVAQNQKNTPAFISNLTKFVTNKSVSASRIYLGMVCVLAGLTIAITIIYSGIRNGFISIGRNPLAKRAIGINLIRVVVVSLIIFAVSLGAAYAIVAG